MMTFILIVLILVVVALSYKHKAQQAEHYAAVQKIHADYAEAGVKQRHRLDTALNTIQDTHREETIHDTHPTHLAARTDLDNDWSAASGLHGAADATVDDHHSAAAAGSTGTAGDQVERDDMLGR